MMMNILLITNKNDITTDFIVKRLTERQLPFYRLNTEDLGGAIKVNFDFNSKQFFLYDQRQNISLNLLQVKSVYYRRPEVNSRSDGLSAGEQNFIRSELIYVLEGLYKILDNAFWVNKVNAIRNAENKIYQLLLANELGFITPNSIITDIPENAETFYHLNSDNCIIKPIKSGLVEGEDEESIIFTNKLELNERNKNRIGNCPVYLQNLIPKNGDVRVTVVGNKLFAALIHSQEIEDSKIDWRKANKSLRHTAIELPYDLFNKCQMLTHKLSLNFAAIDFIKNKKGDFIFLEINPNGNWAWVEKQLNCNISNAITDLLEENYAKKS